MVGARLENDENRQPGENLPERPNDEDRARFGFKPRSLHEPQDRDIEASVAVPRVQDSLCKGSNSLDLMDLVNQALGDPDEMLPVLRLKPTAGKYDFKDKISDLQDMIRPLKNAVSEQRQRHLSLMEALRPIEEEINSRLQRTSEELVEKRLQLQQTTQELSTSRREAADRSITIADLLGNLEAERRQLVLLQEQKSVEGRRADVAELSLAAAQRELEARAREAAEWKAEAEALRLACNQQVGEAAELLRRQIEDAAKDRQALLASSKALETELQAELVASKANAVNLQGQLDACAAARHCAESRVEVLDKQVTSLESDLCEAREESLRRFGEQQETHKAELQALTEELAQYRKAFAQDREALEDQHRRAFEAMELKMKLQTMEHEECQRQREAHQQDCIDGLKLAHSAQLDESERLSAQRLVQCEQELRKQLESQKLNCMAQLEEKAGVLAQKDAELRDSMHSIKAIHQEQIAGTEKLLRQKESDLNEAVSSLKTLHQAQMEAKDELLRQRDASLHESLQSIKLLQNSSSEQMMLERQRVQKLEAEVQQLREAIDVFRAEGITSAQRSDRLQVELSSSREHISDLRAVLQRAEAEREQLQERSAEKQAALQEELALMRMKLSAQAQELGTTKSRLEEKEELSVRLEHQRHELEVEFRSYKDHNGTSNQQQMAAITDLKLTVDKLSKQVEQTRAEADEKQVNVTKQLSYIQSLEHQLARAEGTRRDLHNAIQELKGNIRVFCRVRPCKDGTKTSLQMLEANKLTVSYSGESYPFSFDRVFAGCTPQASIFDEVAGLVQSALDGYKVCIFAYGQTGSGKTFTMQGAPEPQSWGLIPRSLSKIFEASEAMCEMGWEWSLNASFLEVYNESLRDLLRQPGDEASGLVHVIKHDDAWGTVVTNLTSHAVTSMAEIERLMAQAAKQRAVGSTDMNSVSSRSHSIFALYLRGVNKELGSELHGALHLVDLAGSERLDRSGATGDRLKETQNINRSLSSLADVFLAKAEGRSHVPFRNSKLTHLMEPCLNGQGKTLMVVNIAPEAENSHETLCSLRFAGQVSQCTTGGKPKRSTKPVPTQVPAASRPITPARPMTASRSETGACLSSRRPAR